MSKKIKTIFIGTPDFGLPAFKALVAAKEFEITAVITQPDKKVGRKQILTPPPVKLEALKNNLPVLQPKKIKDITESIKKIKPDLAVVIAYAQIIPEDILDIPQYGFINVHGSLLPKYRGASCLQASILNGDTETGITVMKMDKGLDTGPILEKFSIPIANHDTAGTLFMKLSELGGKNLVQTLKKYIAGEIKPQAQNNEQATYVGLLKKEDGKIDWKKNANEVERHIRAMNPWPGAFSGLRRRDEELIILKIISAKHGTLKINKYKSGEIFIEKNNLAIQCGQDSLILKKLQLAGKKETDSKSFIQGYKNLIGASLQ